MTKEELKQEAEEKLLQAELDYCHELSNPCEPSELPYSELLRFETGYKRGYLASAEPREKHIAELEKENAELKKACDETQTLLDKQIEATYKLDKENAELKTVKIPQLERRIASIRGCHSVDAKKLNTRIEQVERLKQENAELKKRVENQKSFLERIRAKFELGKLERKEIEGYLTNEQLTAAKDLLKRWVDDKVYTVSEQKDLIADTEQFLKEEVNGY